MKLETPIEGEHGGCLHCGYQHDILPLNTIIAVGFGDATVTKDGVVVYSENYCENNYITAKEAEEMALKEPESDWRIHLIAPLSERHYQRQAVDTWVLYEKGIGFA